MIEGNLRLNVAVPRRMRRNKLIIIIFVLTLLLILTTDGMTRAVVWRWKIGS